MAPQTTVFRLTGTYEMTLLMTTFRADELRNLTARLANAVGVRSEDAEIFARVLVDADLQGVSTHGISRLSIYLQRIDKGLIDPRADLLVRRNGGSVRALDAGNGWAIRQYPPAGRVLGEDRICKVVFEMNN